MELILKINSKMIETGAEVYYTKEMMDILESHMLYLREHQNTTKININDKELEVYKGDLYGYLTNMKVPMFLHWVIMRMSGMHSTFDFGPTYSTLLIPSETVVDKIRQLYVSKPGTVGL